MYFCLNYINYVGGFYLWKHQGGSNWPNEKGMSGLSAVKYHIYFSGKKSTVHFLHLYANPQRFIRKIRRLTFFNRIMRSIFFTWSWQGFERLFAGLFVPLDIGFNPIWPFMVLIACENMRTWKMKIQITVHTTHSLTYPTFIDCGGG